MRSVESMTRTMIGLVAATAIGFTLLGQPVRAQVPALSTSGGDTLITIVPVRSSIEVRRDLDAARAAQDAAESSARLAADLRDRAKLRIDVQKREISTLNARLKLAKKEKNQAEVDRLEADIRKMKLELDLLERRSELRGAEIDLAKTMKSLAEATASVHERELELSAGRDERLTAQLGSPDPSQSVRLAEVEKKIREGIGRVLSAQKTAAEQRMNAAKRERELVERRKKLYDAQIKLLGEIQK